MELMKLNKIMEKMKELPTLPIIANRVQQMLYNPKTNTSELAEVIEKDQSITSKILKLINSAFYSLPERITNISQAISHLGYKNISQIVMTLSIFDSLKTKHNNVFDRREFWLHSIATAALGKKIAETMKYPEPEDVFTSCLLHDIGKVFMDGFLKDEFKAVLSYADEKNISFYDAENAILGVNHSMIGEWIARSWKLPVHVIAAIKHHHQPLEEREGLVLSKDISIDIVRLADIAVRTKGFGINGDGKNYKPAITEDLFKRLPIMKDDIEKIILVIKDEMGKYEVLLNLSS